MTNEASSLNRLDHSPDWQALLTHFELTSGFAFIVLLVPSEHIAAECREALATFLSKRGKRLNVIETDNPGKLAVLARTLLTEGTGPLQVNAGDAIWVERVVAEDADDYVSWRDAWREAALNLNQFRNPLVRSFDASLLFVGAPWLKEAIREEAPDLWSIRSVVTVIESGHARMDLPEFETDLSELETGPTPDPQLALRKAEEIAGRPGWEEMQATLLLRAASAFSQRREFALCAECLRKVLAISKQTPLPARLLAEIYCLQGHIASGRGEVENAKESFAKSLAISQDASDVTARNWHGIGGIAVMQGDFEAAHQHYLKALAISERLGDLRLAAVLYTELGETDSNRGNFPAARDWYLQSVAAWERLGERHAAARPYRGLGMVALEQRDLSAARQWYLKALAIFEQAGNLHNTATMCVNLGTVEAIRGDMEASARWLVRSIDEFRQAAQPESADQVAEGFQALYRNASPRDQEKMLTLWQEAHLSSSFAEVSLKQ